MNKAPRSHEWLLAEPGLWWCMWCNGYVESEAEPDKEAVARSLDELREQANDIQESR